MNRIQVHLNNHDDHSYEIIIGRNAMDRAGILLARGTWASSYFIITDSNVSALHGKRIQEQLAAVDLPAGMIVFPAGEESKNIRTALWIVEELIRLGADRNSGLIGLGGGVVGDLTGFVASTFMRGLPYINIPTSLLAQVDSSIGGKTAIDLPAGKNLMGTFHQPKMVFIDLAFLETLPEKEFTNGIGEIVKYGVIDDSRFFQELQDGTGMLRERDMGFLEGVVAKSCSIKKRIVEIDETEKGVRRFLNFGHTIGHALEAEAGYRLAHGEAVAIGMTAAAMISRKMNYLPAAEARKIETLLQALGLPFHIPGDLSTEGILSRMKVDKKKSKNAVNFVLLKNLGVPFVNGGVSQALVEEVIEEMRS